MTHTQGSVDLPSDLRGIVQKLESIEERLLAIERKPTFQLRDVRLVTNVDYVILMVSIVLIAVSNVATYYGAPPVIPALIAIGVLVHSMWRTRSRVVKNVAVGIVEHMNMKAEFAAEVIKAKKDTDAQTDDRSK